MKAILWAFLALVTVVGCKSTPQIETGKLESLGQWSLRQEQKSWDHMQENISPKEPKVPGEAPPLKGIVVAALHKKDPDYYFHWVRDSAHVMSLVAEAYALKRPYVRAEQVHTEFSDFATLTQKLQAQKSKFGLGEPRYQVDGTVDPLPWSRPQYDGPALRALAVLRYLKATASEPNKATAKLARQVLLKDLAFVAGIYDKRGFDIWEELNGDSYQVRLVQLAAMQKGADWLASQKPSDAGLVKRLRAGAKALAAVLEDHWDPAKGYIKSQLAVVATDGYTAKKTDLDSAVILAVMDSDLDQVPNSVLDDRVQATVSVLEDLFKKTFPINARTDVGLGYGRYFGDVYYGGNPWYLITAYFAEFHYRLAKKLKDGASFAITPRNLAFLNFSRIRNAVQAGQVLQLGSALHTQLEEDLVAKADSILRRFQIHTPLDGQLYEQFDRVTGQPTSSRGIGWSHSAFLSALYERQRLTGKAW